MPSRTFISGGSASANSTRSWSRNGTRASTEVRHRHLVDAHEEQLGEAVLELEVGHLLEQVGAGPVALGLVPEPLDDRVGVGMRACRW